MPIRRLAAAAIPTIAFCLLFAASAFAADQTLPTLFKRAKDEFNAGDYAASLADFQLLDTASARPGLEADRAKLLPVITFYRGANLAALRRTDEAKEVFITYLDLVPTATIASPPFPKATVDLFEQARKAAANRSTTLAKTFGTFTIPAGWTLAADEKWADSPVRYLLTPAQKKEYGILKTAEERAAFVDAFWKQLDPTPSTDVNELRMEFERRVAFADANFATQRLPGRETERGAVFTIMGPPTYAGITALDSGGDVMDQLRAGGRANVRAGGRELERQGTSSRETWYYRIGRIPTGVPFKEVKFDFMTKEGYGSAVLQKDPEPMQTLGIAAEAARRDRRLN